MIQQSFIAVKYQENLSAQYNQNQPVVQNKRLRGLCKRLSLELPEKIVLKLENRGVQIPNYLSSTSPRLVLDRIQL